MIAREYINCTGRKVLEYKPPDTVWLDFHFILTLNKKLKIGYPYLKIENWLTDKPTGIKLLNVWDKDEIVFLEIQDLKTLNVNVLSHSLEYSGEFWLWCLADIQTIAIFGGKN